MSLDEGQYPVSPNIGGRLYLRLLLWSGGDDGDVAGGFQWMYIRRKAPPSEVVRVAPSNKHQITIQLGAAVVLYSGTATRICLN